VKYVWNGAKANTGSYSFRYYQLGAFDGWFGFNQPVPGGGDVELALLSFHLSCFAADVPFTLQIVADENVLAEVTEEECDGSWHRHVVDLLPPGQAVPMLRFRLHKESFGGTEILVDDIAVLVDQCADFGCFDLVEEEGFCLPAGTVTGACFIDEKCVAGGESHPETPCLACLPEIAPGQWSAAVTGCDDGNLCTLGDYCEAGVCHPGADEFDCDLGNPCVAGACDVAAGECVFSAVECDDGHPCTDDVCMPFNGCLHLWKNCSDANVCTSDSCSLLTGECVHMEILCDDGDPCTKDKCDSQDGCYASPKCSDNSPCTLEYCEPATGVCVYPLKCVDGDPATKDQCDFGTGECTFSPLLPKSCWDDDKCTSSTVDPATGKCVSVTKGCDDGKKGTVDYCVPETGDCAHDDLDCDDGDACTMDSLSHYSGCLHYPVDCSDGDACTVDLCESVDGCYHEPKVCDDQDPETVDWCDAFLECQHDYSACDDGDKCTWDTIDENSQCVHAPRDCADDSLCTIDSCDALIGCVHEPKDCDDDCDCTMDYCQVWTGMCIHQEICCQPDPDCDDGDPCTNDWYYWEWGCKHTPVNCDDDNYETIDSCDWETGCFSTPVECADGDLCTYHTKDEDWQCVTWPKECDDGDVCTSDQCIPETGECVNASLCDDLDACTQDSCDSETGECTNVPLSSDDGDLCTIDSCDPESGVSNLAKDCIPEAPSACLDYSCDDATGNCVETSKDCSDQDLCTEDFCEPEAGCYWEPVPTDDGDPCTNDLCTPEAGVSHLPRCVGTSCSVGVCEPETGICYLYPGTCNDGLACTEDWCGFTVGCYHVPKTCSSLGLCKWGHCDPAGGSCEWGDIDCDDGNPCTEESCSFYGGCNSQPSPKEGLPCDNDPCTEGDICSAGECVPGTWVCIEDCANGLDDDADGWIDCLDPTCAHVSHCQPVPATESKCRNGLDDDQDGASDCEDVDCQVMDPCKVLPETEVYCYDWKDNDGDGQKDCADPDCSGSAFCQPGTPPAAGDKCSNAFQVNDGQPLTTALLGQALVYEGSTTEAKQDFAKVCQGENGFGRDVFYELKVGADLLVTVQLSLKGSNWGLVYVLKGDCDAGSVLACDDEGSWADPKAHVTVPLPPGTYYVVVDGEDSDDHGDYELVFTVELPPESETNCVDGLDDDTDGKTDCQDDECQAFDVCIESSGEDCDTAFPVGHGPPVSAALIGVGLVYEGTTEGMTADLTGPCKKSSSESPDAVYKLVTVDSLVVTAKLVTEGYAFDPVVYLMQEGCGPGAVLACEGTNWSSLVDITVPLVPGTHYVAVDGVNEGDSGQYTLNLSFAAPPPVESVCGDELDDDADGKTDCEDEECGLEPGCLDPFEPNDFLSEATDLGLLDDQGIELPAGAAIGPHLEDDWFSFSAPGGTLVIATQLSGSYGTTAVFYDAAGSLVSTAADWTDGIKTWTAAAAEAGTYYLKVSSASSWQLGEYAFSLSLAPALESETNCNDMLDNDADGKLNCEDDECSQSPWCGWGDNCQQPNLVYGGQPVGNEQDGLELEYAGTTAGVGHDFIPTSCAEGWGTAPDAVWELNLEDKMNVVIRHGFIDALNALVYVRQDHCQGEEVGCVEPWSPSQKVNAYLMLAPGTYYVILDANDATSIDAYSLDFEFHSITETEVDCADGLDNDGDGLKNCYDPDCGADPYCAGENCVAALEVNAAKPIDGDDFDLLLSYEESTTIMSDDYVGSCSGEATYCGDAVWRFELLEEAVATISHTFDWSLDLPAVYLFKGECLPENEVACAGSEEGPAVIEELLLAPAEYFVVVDGMYNWDSGPYTLELLFTAP